MRPPRLPWLAPATAFAIASCGPAPALEVDKPAAPDMAPIVASYDKPAGTLDAETLRRAIPLAQTRSVLVTATDIYTALQDGLNAGAETYRQEHGAQSGFESAGWLRVTRICNGLSDTPAPDPANGQLVLTMGFTEQGLDPVIWGGATACQYRIGGKNIVLADASSAQFGLRVWIGTSLTFAQLASAPAILALDLVATVDGAVSDARFDFRIGDATTPVELRFDGTGGDVIAGVHAATSNLAFRAVNGNFECDLPTQTCVSQTGVVLSY
jgi:hypothetical protein